MYMAEKLSRLAMWKTGELTEFGVPGEFRPAKRGFHSSSQALTGIDSGHMVSSIYRRFYPGPANG